MTTQQDFKDMNRNPTGKGGFADNPQNRNPGGWRKEVSFSYQYKRFMAMSVTELEEWNNTTSKNDRTVVEDLAFRRVSEARTSLPDVKEITDRTEGKAVQLMDMTVVEGRLSTEEKIKDFLNDTNDNAYDDASIEHIATAESDSTDEVA